MILTESIVFRFVQYSRNIPKETPKESSADSCMFRSNGLFPRYLPEVFPEVLAESKYSIVCLVVYLFILCLVNEE
jgi:hypothetical protein